MARVPTSALREAAKAAFEGDTAPRGWERQSVQRQASIRQMYLAQARLLGGSADLKDQSLALKVETSIRSMPQPDSQRLALARELRAAATWAPERENKDRDRTR